MVSEKSNLNTVLQDYSEWKKKEEEKNLHSAYTIGSGIVNVDTVSQYSKVHDEHITLAKNLNPKHVQGSDRQKHGEAVEFKEIHDRNVNAIKEGRDAQARAADSKTDPKVDFYDGDTAYQSKFLSNDSTGTKTFKEFYDGEYNGLKKIVPKGMGDKVRAVAKTQEKAYKDKALECKKNGDMDGYRENLKNAKKCKEIANTIEESNLTTEDAKQLISKRYKQAVISIAKDAHEAGMKGAAAAATVTSVLSGATNMYSVLKGDKELADAIIDTAKKTSVAALKGYGITSGGSLLASGLKVAATAAGSAGYVATQGVLQNIASSSAPTMIIVGTIELTKSINSYAKGEITGKELGIELGEKAVGMTASYIGGTVGTAIAGPVGGAILGMASYMISTAFYKGIFESIQIAKTAAEMTRLIPLFDAAYNELQKARLEFEKAMYESRVQRLSLVKSAYENMEKTVYNCDFNGFNASLSNLLDVFAKGLKYHNQVDFDRDMLDDNCTILI